jgi:hemerythrin-like metal-binding protein
MSHHFEWDASRYVLGIPDMDHGHGMIIDCMNQLHAGSVAQASRIELGNIFDRLVRVTVEHFSDEERYMAECAYPDAARHRLLHQQILERLYRFQLEFRRTGVLPERLFNFFGMWLQAHMGDSDVQYARYCKAA